MQKIDPKNLLPMDLFAGSPALRIDLAYARPDNLLFGEALYRPRAKLWLHEKLAEIVRYAARDCHSRHGFQLVLYDGLRTVDAQEAMLKTKRVQANLHWITQHLLSKPGSGGHPRGMAVDIGLAKDGTLLDMGTPFDYLAEDSSPEKNPAHRDYKNLSDDVKCNRVTLTDAMMNAAAKLNTPLLPLPQEWWDFRLPPDIFEAYAPLRDSDLPPEMRMMDSSKPT
jgi:D-alanyl-D-alanine dipeptidase